MLTGAMLTVVEQEVYLGSLLSSAGSAAMSVTRRLGEARAAFWKICRIWKHANITKHSKVQIYMSCIVSKLLYSLDCECLRSAERKRLDAFHCQCLRAICRIPHSMLSHITNVEVLAASESQPLTSILDKRQLLLFGKIATLPDSSTLRASLFQPGSVLPKQLNGPRKQGRPRLTWATVQHSRVLEFFNGSQNAVEQYFLDKNNADTSWAHIVHNH